MEVTQEKTTYSINGQFVATVENGSIYQIINAYSNQKTKIGVTQDVFDELQGITDGYYDKLVELGAIVPPKTPEQIIEEQQKAMQDMFDVIKELKAEVEVLKNGHYANRKNAQPTKRNELTTVSDIVE